MSTTRVAQPAGALSVRSVGTGLVRAVTDTTTGAEQIVDVGVPEVRAAINELSSWSTDGRYHSCPRDVAEHFVASENASLALPYLRDVTDAPYFAKTGDLVVTNGYNRDSGIRLSMAKALNLDPVPEVPTREQVASAVWQLQELFVDFPFSDGEEHVDLRRWQADRPYRMTIGTPLRANQIAKVIQPFVLELVDGSIPLHALIKPLRGTGAGYAQDGVGLVCFGRVPEVEGSKGGDEAEMRKTIHTHSMRGTKHFVLDNQPEGVALKSESLATAQTSGRVGGRILGGNRIGSGNLAGPRRGERQ